MVEIFSINFAADTTIPTAQKYAYMKVERTLLGLFVKVQEGVYPELERFLSQSYGKKIFDISTHHRSRVLVWGDARYPKKLTQLDRPPLVLYVQGLDIPADRSMLSVVGTREPTNYGLRVTTEIVQQIAGNQVGVVSGLARGVDTAAHRATLKVGGYTTVVLAHGLDCIYPRENRSLKQAILEAGGTLCTEYPWGVRPARHHFRDRNRINAALSDGVLVIEAGVKSGTRITVHEALLLNKEIYSIPGPIDSKMSIFPHQLIVDGAKMVTSAADILEDISPGFVTLDKACSPVVRDDLDTAILHYFDTDEAKGIDGFFEQSTHCLPEIIERVSQFEIENVLMQNVDGRYVLTGKI